MSSVDFDPWENALASAISAEHLPPTTLDAVSHIPWDGVALAGSFGGWREVVDAHLPAAHTAVEQLKQKFGVDYPLEFALVIRLYTLGDPAVHSLLSQVGSAVCSVLDVHNLFFELIVVFLLLICFEFNRRWGLALVAMATQPSRRK